MKAKKKLGKARKKVNPPPAPIPPSSIIHTYPALTRLQAGTLRILAFHCRAEGFAPTRTELSAMVSSPPMDAGNLHRMLNRIEELGYIEIAPDQPNGISLTERGEMWFERLHSGLS